ncbi:hypothetical protein ACFVH6_23470 [Spirillospora sp. NPDC127200]
MAANTTRTPATNTTDATSDAMPAPAADTATTAPGTTPGTPDTTATPADAPAGLTDTAAAVWSAVAATPAATVPAIADVSGLTRKIVKEELAVLQAAGHLTRTPGDKGVNTDVWTLTAPADTAAAGDEDGDGAGGDAPAPAGVVSADAIADAVAIIQGEADRRAAAEAELQREIAEEEARRAKVLAELARRQTAEETRAALADLLTAVTTAYAAVAAGDDAATVAGLEKVFAATNDVRRAAKAPARPSATGGTSRTGNSGGTSGSGHRAAPRPLRPDVAAHMAAHPDAELTPGEVARVLGRSSGAVANAMATMANDGEIVMTSEKPVRYRYAAPAAPVGEATDTPADDSTDTTPAAALDVAPADTAPATA